MDLTSHLHSLFEVFGLAEDFHLPLLIDDLLALDSKVHFDFSDRRLELTATFSIPTYSDDTEYGCALYESVVRLCMRLLWLTVNRNNATYCASVEDIAVQYCFFDILLTSLSPRNCIPPEVLLRVSMHSACSTSENALEKPLDIRKLDNSSYQALGACFKPYKAFDDV
ncbi:hypothetical protein Tco_0261242 [Tanacetum coccineum]